MSQSTEHGIPDDLIVIVYSGAMVALIAVAVGLAILAKTWTNQAEPNVRAVAEPVPVEVHH